MSAEKRVVLLPEPIEEEARRLLDEAGLEVLQSPDAKPETVKPLLMRAEAVVLRTGIRMSADLIECGAKLGAISRTGAGFDNVDVQAATRRGVIVTSSIGANTHTVAEHTLALILAASKALPALDRETRAGNWKARHSYLPRDLRGSVLGAIGFGRIGQEVARACADVFAMTVIAHDAFLPDAAKGAQSSWVAFCGLEELLEKADVVTIHVPLTPDTKDLLSAARIARMKPGAIVVNTSRGGIIDEAALAAALADGRLGGAGIDVFEKEPPAADNPLLSAPRAILTPHAAALTRECTVRMAVLAVQRVLDQFAGLVPDNVANPEVLAVERWRALSKR
jgi:D-3-phosphoglycerate dehydrogenase / 2-oxoglutarate reductase